MRARTPSYTLVAAARAPAGGGAAAEAEPLSDAFERDGAVAAEETAADASIDRSSSAPNAARRFSALRGVAAAETVPGLGMSTSARSRGARMAATDARTLNVGALRRRSVASAPASAASRSTSSRKPKMDATLAPASADAATGKPRAAAGVFFRLAPPGEGDRLSSAASNDASDAASATATASAAASTARRSIADGGARGTGCGAASAPRGPLSGVVWASSGWTSEWSRAGVCFAAEAGRGGGRGGRARDGGSPEGGG